MHEIKTDKLYELIVVELKKMMNTKGLKPGDKLPSERELVNMFKVSRSSVRQAIATLAAEGLVVVRQGGGTYLAASENDGDLDEIAKSLSKYLVIQQIDPREIVEVRITLETQSAYLAAKRIDDNGCTVLRSLLEENRIFSNRSGSIDEMNMDLHLMIAEYAGNKALYALIRFVYRMMEENMWGWFKSKSASREADIKRHWAQHVDIVEAICSRSPDDALGAMRRHLLDIDDEMVAIMGSELE